MLALLIVSGHLLPWRSPVSAFSKTIYAVSLGSGMLWIWMDEYLVGQYCSNCVASWQTGPQAAGNCSSSRTFLNRTLMSARCRMWVMLAALCSHTHIDFDILDGATNPANSQLVLLRMEIRTCCSLSAQNVELIEPLFSHLCQVLLKRRDLAYKSVVRETDWVHRDSGRLCLFPKSSPVISQTSVQLTFL